MRKASAFGRRAVALWQSVLPKTRPPLAQLLVSPKSCASRCLMGVLTRNTDLLFAFTRFCAALP